MYERFISALRTNLRKHCGHHEEIAEDRNCFRLSTISHSATCCRVSHIPFWTPVPGLGGDYASDWRAVPWQLVADLSGKNEADLDAAYRRYGDLGGVAQEVLPQRATPELDVLDVEQAFRKIAAARGPTAKAALVRDLLALATPLEAKYIVKIMTGTCGSVLKRAWLRRR